MFYKKVKKNPIIAISPVDMGIAKKPMVLAIVKQQLFNNVWIACRRA